MAKIKYVYTCSVCEYESTKWIGKCPSCSSFNSFFEDIVEKEKNIISKDVQIQTLDNIESINEVRTKTNIKELDRVLSGGIVEGSLILVGGDPGIGKSTLLLQLCQNIGKQNKKIFYISGEESTNQIKLRAQRLAIDTKNLYLVSEMNLNLIEKVIRDNTPQFVIIDSIQTVYKEEISSVIGSVSQVKECTQVFMKIAKSLNISIIIVGHVTKEGALAGPKVLEHMVDTVLYFEGEKMASYRIIRAVKNRFGSTNEIGVFDMQQNGLVEINNPSEYMLAGRHVGVSGSAVTCSIEGTRPILTEVQALVSYTNFGMPRRMATGLDYNRIVMLIAVLEKKAGICLGNYDSYVNIAGGMKIIEPSLDAAVVASIASSYKNESIDPFIMIFGEIGLAGELRAVTLATKRLCEASKLGFKKCIIPHANLKNLNIDEDIEIIGVKNIEELISNLL